MEFSDILLDVVSFREVKNVGFAQAAQVSEQVLAMFDDGEYDVCTLFYSEFQSVISQIPTAQQLIRRDDRQIDVEL